MYANYAKGQLSEQVPLHPMDPQARAGDYPRYRRQIYDSNRAVKITGGYNVHTISQGDTTAWLTATAGYNYNDAEGRLRFREQQTQVRTGDPGTFDHSLGAWEEYRYDALGRRVAILTLGHGVCSSQQASCYTAKRFMVWGGEQIFYERSMIRSDTLTKPNQYGQLYYTQAGGIAHPVGVIHEDSLSQRRAFSPM